MMRRPDALDLAQARNDAEIASLEAAKRRAEEAEKEAAEARARAEAALALAMANSGWSLAALQARIDQVIDATVHQSIARGSAAIDKDLLRVHRTYVNVEARRAHSYGPEIKKKTKEEVNSRFFTACLVEIKRRDGDQTVAREELTKTPLFDAVIKSLMGTKISVFGSAVKKAFVAQIVVDAVKFASDIVKGNHTVLHAPTQCGKTACAGLAACVGKLKKGPAAYAFFRKRNKVVHSLGTVSRPWQHRIVQRRRSAIERMSAMARSGSRILPHSRVKSRRSLFSHTFKDG
jgi:hypothetical protein